MDKPCVISDKFQDIISGRLVQAAVFTSYNFEPHFFEVDVIPYLLNDSIPYSNDDRVRKYQVMEALRDSELDIEMFFDQPVFESSVQSPAMEYLFHGVNLLPFAFHAKNIYLLVKDINTGVQTLLMAAGSNNLTRAGWWENIETQHWEVITPTAVDKIFLRQLQSDMSWLMARRNLETSDKAIEKIASFLAGCKPTNVESQLYYFGLEQRNFFDFISESNIGLSKSGDWNLEIISPFFANDPESLLHENFYNMGVQDITMLLPFDQDRKALCDLEYYETIRKARHVSWGQWGDENKKALGISTEEEQYRKLHAKVFHFYNNSESWIFSGSVNFTRNALYKNVETGFLVKLPLIKPLLQALSEKTDVICLADLHEQELESNKPNPNHFDIHLGYDWKEKRLQGTTSNNLVLIINILNKEGQPVIANWVIDDSEKTYEGDKSLLEALLKRSGFVTITIQAMESEDSITDQDVCILQTGWSHKPVEIPDLSPSEILLIYVGMSEERRQILLMNAKIKSFLNQNLGGELNAADDDKTHRQFFSEYAEIFHAFRHLRIRLHKLLNDGGLKQLDYYLSGSGADSLPALIEKATATDLESHNATTSYLLLLSVHEILSSPAFKSRVNVSDNRTRVSKLIKNIERSALLKLEQGTDRKKFFAWFREQFLKTYSNGKDVPSTKDPK